MSDERVGADAGTDIEERRGGRTAVVTRPQRPTGKRSRVRADAAGTAVDLAKSGVDTKVKTAKKVSGPSRNPFAFVYGYLKQVVAELRKVIWPNRKQMMTYTSVVLAFLAFMVALIGLADFGLAKLVLLVFG
ncbi:preprotein translocase subunit SecE [Mycobacterium xenopi]|uniref:Protein translocase subunit SecE n=1 Tax=Mycobacterium xenopi TaxID=1789 RepID=A0AAD1H326_MYCXE|nr:preprotein translocase subunit SecE [Mycobacterium xenopi]EID13174.1 preprotein translocase subunit SecE [Mycobacterium xenopi RIVM700367]MDA3640357.1 preprotein translocase subunit SecE [Mycobacterium xenopi]MDA3658611.1 preprotein translocase subunit SecE [Mycobacterium xenopi]MDA3663417.1 preprotein translocase subunit SecE [Mycobacterium xenopi]ORX10409.1 preprotein translocase subunit SecE [Mycobacterium xenopi]